MNADELSDAIRVNRTELAVAGSTLLAHRAPLEAALADYDRPAAVLQDVLEAIGRVLDGWRPNAGSGG